MLALVRKQMIGDAKQTLDGDPQANLFASLADRTALNGFEKVHLAADDAPTFRLRREFSQRKEYAAAFVNEQDTGSHSGLGIRL